MINKVVWKGKEKRGIWVQNDKNEESCCWVTGRVGTQLVSILGLYHLLLTSLLIGQVYSDRLVLVIYLLLHILKTTPQLHGLPYCLEYMVMVSQMETMENNLFLMAISLKCWATIHMNNSYRWWQCRSRRNYHIDLSCEIARGQFSN